MVQLGCIIRTTFRIDSCPRHDIVGDRGAQLVWVGGLAPVTENLVDHLQQVNLGLVEVKCWSSLLQGLASCEPDLVNRVPVPFLPVRLHRGHVHPDN